MSKIHISYRSSRPLTQFPANAIAHKLPRSPRIRSIVIKQQKKKDDAPNYNTTRVALAVGLSLIVIAGAAWAYYHPELTQKWAGKMKPVERSPTTDNLTKNTLLTGDSLQAREKAAPVLSGTIPTLKTNPLLIEDLLEAVEKATPTNTTFPNPESPPQTGLAKVFAPPSPRLFDALHLHSLGRTAPTSPDGLVIHLEQSSNNKWESSVGPQNQSPSSTGYLRTGLINNDPAVCIFDASSHSSIACWTTEQTSACPEITEESSLEKTALWAACIPKLLNEKAPTITTTVTLENIHEASGAADFENPESSEPSTALQLYKDSSDTPNAQNPEDTSSNIIPGILISIPLNGSSINPEWSGSWRKEIVWNSLGASSSSGQTEQALVSQSYSVPSPFIRAAKAALSTDLSSPTKELELERSILPNDLSVLTKAIPFTLGTLQALQASILPENLQALQKDLPATITALQTLQATVLPADLRALSKAIPTAITTLQALQAGTLPKDLTALQKDLPATIAALQTLQARVLPADLRALSKAIPTAITTLQALQAGTLPKDLTALQKDLPATIAALE
ncbi:MAG: hypothetical protein K2X08_02180, partial [Chlamydiales bacterium]|nr:hypothetical protein [Chlamydiales bacterium]